MNATRTAAPPPEYLSVRQLAKCTPWSEDAIRTMVARGHLRSGVHFFQPHGPRTRLLFKWAAIVAFIETPPDKPYESSLVLANGMVVDLEEAAKTLHRLHG